MAHSKLIKDKDNTLAKVENLLKSAELAPAITETNMTIIITCNGEAEAMKVYRVLSDENLVLNPHSRFGCTWLIRRNNRIQHLSLSNRTGRQWFS